MKRIITSQKRRVTDEWKSRISESVGESENVGIVSEGVREEIIPFIKERTWEPTKDKNKVRRERREFFDDLLNYGNDRSSLK